MNFGKKSIEKYHLDLFPKPKPQSTPHSPAQMYNKHLHLSNHFRTFSRITKVRLFIFWIIWFALQASHSSFIPNRENREPSQIMQIEKALLSICVDNDILKKILLQFPLT